MPNGFSEAMRIFTKMLKPLFTTLQKKGHFSITFIDDSYFQGNTKAQCQEKILRLSIY